MRYRLVVIVTQLQVLATIEVTRLLLTSLIFYSLLIVNTYTHQLSASLYYQN